MDPKNCVYYANRAMAFLKLKNYKWAIDDANIAIDIDPNYPKGFYWWAKANEALGNFYSMACDLGEILNLESSEEINNELE